MSSLSHLGCSSLLGQPELTDTQPPLYRISRCCPEMIGPGGRRPGGGDCTGPSKGGLRLRGTGAPTPNGRSLPMQTDTCNSSSGGLQNVDLLLHFMSTCLLVSGANKLGVFCFVYFSFHRVVLAGAFVPHPSTCCCSQKWRFLTLSWPTAPSTENEFYLFSETKLSSDT